MLGYGSLLYGDNVGDDPGEMSALPAVDVGSGRTVLDVALAGDSTCLLLDHGGVRCFGVANGGNFGDPRNNGETPCDGAAASPPWSPGYLCMVQNRPADQPLPLRCDIIVRDDVNKSTGVYAKIIAPASIDLLHYPEALDKKEAL